MNLERSLTPDTKIHSKWFKDLNGRLDTMKLLEENIGKILFDINCRKIFFDPPPRIMEIKINETTKFKSFYTAKETTSKMKDSPQNGRKYLQMKQLTRD